MDFLSLIRNMDKEVLAKSIAQAQAYLQTEEGRKNAELLSKGKMPDGSTVPEELQTVAEALKKDKNAQSALKAFVDNNG